MGQLLEFNITRIDRMRAITLFGNPQDPYSQRDAILKTLEEANTILPSNYNAKLTGAAKTSSESMNRLVLVLLAGIVISYMILASQFNHLFHPVYILLALPFSFSGALAALYIFNQSINMYSFIGFILLMGLVKKNSIILVEFINQLRHKVNKLNYEIVVEAASLRLRPILMTSFSSIAAAIPPALAIGPGEETRIPMAVTVLGGMVLSTLITLYVVPVAYGWLETQRTQ